MDAAIKGLIGIGDGGLALYALVVCLFSLLLGGLIGVEREIYGHAAGLRTHILISLGSTVVGVISVANEGAGYGYLLLSCVVIALGFLSAGSIIQTGKDIRGITTSSTLWVVGIIGYAIGASYVLESIVFTIIALIVLVILHYVESKTSKKNPTVTLIVDSQAQAADDIVKIATTYGLKIVNISSKISQFHDQDVLKIVVSLARAPRDTIKTYADELQSVLNPISISTKVNRVY